MSARLRERKLSRSLILLLSAGIFLLAPVKQAHASELVAQREETEVNVATEIGTSSPQLPPGENTRQSLPDSQTSLNLTSEPTRLLLKLSERRLYVFVGEDLLVTYPVAIGKNTTPTPTGEYEVFQMISDPIWQNPWTGEVTAPGPDSALGLRWIGFWTDGTDYIGFHGTPTVNSIGNAASNGCVRMFNEDVVALFQQVKMGTTVVVEN
ncbi:L,D-transpeptidase [Oscillatoria salina]|uniref:L,D-transpeptidase n=1 Tax=Oscillatoria salina TaxID=331517 RepID=UPI0013BE1A01|nr:L,D-transpeptidase [Oscillatoria salina]MBZ8180151.1 L,D-transpeptidase [Oscillatoria salina IIICB1]NET88611.1 L,D-transpeptidase [Kamptonema sp. SIO1D9]